MCTRAGREAMACVRHECRIGLLIGFGDDETGDNMMIGLGFFPCVLTGCVESYVHSYALCWLSCDK
jgi:hypothetical protein